MKFSIKDFFSKCDQIRRKLRIWSHLLKKSLNFIFCAVSRFPSNIPLVTLPISDFANLWSHSKKMKIFAGVLFTFQGALN